MGNVRFAFSALLVVNFLPGCGEPRGTKPKTCLNGMRDGDETDVDCGGACGGCHAGKPCRNGADCVGFACEAGRCLPSTRVSFAAGPSYTDAVTNVIGIGAADIDHDRRAEIFYLTETRGGGTSLRMIRLREDGTLSPPRVLLSTEGPSVIWLADVDHDGEMDLLVLISAPRSVRLLRGNGRGEFVMGPTSPIAREQTMALGDWDGDGSLDLAAVESNNGLSASLHVYRGARDGSFTYMRGTTAPLQSVGNLMIIDVDGDVAGELVVSAYNGFSVFRVAADYRCLAVDLLKVGGGYRHFGLPADLDVDGRPDLLVTNAGGPVLELLLARGPEAPLLERRTIDTMYETTGPASGDFNGDGFIDLASAAPKGNAVVFATGMGGGAFTLPVPMRTATGPIHLAAADLNADGTLDIVTGGMGATIQTLLNGGF